MSNEYIISSEIKLLYKLLRNLWTYITLTLEPPSWPFFIPHEDYFSTHLICHDVDENFGECYCWILFYMIIIQSSIFISISCHLELPSFGRKQAAKWNKCEEMYILDQELENEVKRLILKFCIYEMKWINSVNYFRNACILLLNQPIFTK